MHETTCCIKTFERPEAAKRLVGSIRKYYPDIPIIVADDSEASALEFSDPNTTLLRLPYDTGLSAGRNAAVDAADTEYVVVLDDDFVFVRRTDLARFEPFVDSGLFDICGGQILVHGEPDTHLAWMHQEGDTLHYQHAREAEGPTACDLVLNFIFGRAETFRRIRWDDDLKLGEHLDFYLRCQEQGARVGFIPSVYIDHCPMRSKKYNSIRHPKAAKYRRLFQLKRGIEHISGTARWEPKELRS